MNHNTQPLPAHASLVAGPDVWIEGEAIDQLARVASLPGCRRAVGLPDLHPGPGIPIGAAFDFDVLRPGLVGSDAGCGVLVLGLSKVKAAGDALERRLRQEFEQKPLPECDPEALLAAAWRGGPRGLLEVAGLPESLAELAEEAPEEDGVESGEIPDLHHDSAALGTIGGGNHFLETGAVGAVADKPAARALGLGPGNHAIIAHSGSRGLGKALLRQWGDAVVGASLARKPAGAPEERCAKAQHDTPVSGSGAGNVVLASEAQEPYLRQLAGTVRFARANRLVLAWRMLQALGVKASAVAGRFDVTHNTAVWTGGGWLHRKGAAPAEAGQPTIVLGSRGAPSWVMIGCGQASCLCSVAHGAGRRMTRNEAIGKIKARYSRASLTRTKLGGRVLCDDNEMLYAEHPDAYKDVEAVVASVEAAGAATRVAALVPLATVKL